MKNNKEQKGLPETLTVLSPKEFRKKAERDMTQRFRQVFNIMLESGKIKRYSHNPEDMTMGQLAIRMYGGEVSGRTTLYNHCKGNYNIPYSSVMLFCTILEIPEWIPYILTGEFIVNIPKAL